MTRLNITFFPKKNSTSLSITTSNTAWVIRSPKTKNNQQRCKIMANNQLTLSIDYSRIAVGIYSYRYSVGDLLSKLEDEIYNIQQSEWNDVEIFIALNFDVSDPFFEEFQPYMIKKSDTETWLIPIHADCSIRKVIENAICHKVDNDDDFKTGLEMDEMAVILLEDLLS